MSKTPTGVIMMCLDAEGREIATVHDFDRDGYGGFTLQRSQEIRCKDRLALAVIDRYANPIIGRAMSNWHRDELLKKLVSDQGHKIHTIMLPQDLGDEEGEA